MRKLFLSLPALAVAGFTSIASAQGFQSVFTKDGIDVWAVGDAGLVHRSFDGGATWMASTIGTQTCHGSAHAGLTAILVADNGEVRRSTDNGGTFVLTSLGATSLRGIEMPDATHAFIVGDAGHIWASTDGGITWSAQISGTMQNLSAVRFRSTVEGWVVGDNGTCLHTTNGGTTWSTVSVGTTEKLRAVDYWGSHVWCVGNNAAAVQSADGVVWTAVNLKLDAKSDLTGV